LGDGELDRIYYELDIIERKGFASYFLVMDDIVKMSPRTCGRGSGAASIVAYCLGITNVDPLEHKLYFERFLNPARIDPPDIEVDFAWDERDDLIKRVIEHFGEDRCARVANHNFFRFQSALRETAKAYGFGDAEISGIEKQLFHFGDKSVVSDPLWQEILSIAEKLEGLPRGLGMHCGGLVITPGPIKQVAPIEKSLEGFPLLSWEKEGTEAAGLVKTDLLGNRSLAVIRDALANLEEQGVFIDRYLWRPIEDKATIEALARGDSIGVFYIESPAMRQLQKKTGAGDFAHIVIHSSIIRPAANRFINEYVRRLKGGAWNPLHPRLAYVLDETYGILCYQEDVSKTAVALAGFNEVDADKLRKVIAKKAGAEKLALYERQFFEGCRVNGVDEGTIKEIWAMMLSFDGYSFCKPHSASYAMVSFQSAY
jgi:DNA polymerase-3 subunit alpha/error-prone DNA polymerase